MVDVDGTLVASRYAGRPVRFAESSLGDSARRAAVRVGELDRELQRAGAELVRVAGRVREAVLYTPGKPAAVLDVSAEARRLDEVRVLLGRRAVQLSTMRLLVEAMTATENLPSSVDSQDATV